MSRPRAELLLKEDGREGVFLVRLSNQANCYTVGIFTKEGRSDSGTVRHYHIKSNDKGKILYYYYYPQNPKTPKPQNPKTQLNILSMQDAMLKSLGSKKKAKLDLVHQ